MFELVYEKSFSEKNFLHYGSGYSDSIYICTFTCTYLECLSFQLYVCNGASRFSLPVQIRLYQLSRLLHDVLPTLHSHLGMHEITPFYYAAPWFLTLFSSQFPIAFVARVMGEFFGRYRIG